MLYNFTLFKFNIFNMKKVIILFSIFLFPIIVYSQGGEGDSVSLKRERWMVGQRMFPSSQIPPDGLTKAIDQRDKLRQQQGFFVQHQKNGSSASIFPIWSSLGPTPGNYGGFHISGRCNFVKYDPVNPNIIYLGTANGGLWKSFDNGTTWIPLTDTLKSLSSGAIEIDGVNNIIYYGTGELNYFTYCYYGYGLYKSTDRGLSFHNTIGLPSPCYIGAIAIKPNERNVVLAAVGSNYVNIQWKAGLYKSTDYGETWTRIVPPSNVQGRTCTDIAFSPDGSKVYIVGPPNLNSPYPYDNGVGFQISNDGGISFSQVDNRVSLQGNSRITLCNANNGNRIYIITSYYDHNCPGYPDDYLIWEYIYRSDDGGNTFTPVWRKTVCTCPHDPNYSCDIGNYQPWYNLFIKVNPDNPDLLYWGTTSIWRSTNGGSSSTFIGGYGTNIHPDFHGLDCYPGDQSKIAIVSDGGVYSSLNKGDSWSNLNSTLSVTQFYSVSADPTNLDNILGGTQDNALQKKLPNFSHEWSSNNGVDGEIGTVTFNPLNPGRVLAQVANTGGLYYSSNGGDVFVTSTVLSNISWILPIIWHPTNPNIVYTAGYLPTGSRQIILISQDDGVNWNPIPSDFPNGPTVEQMAISTTNPSEMFASIGSFAFWPWSWSYQALYKSINGGTNWVNLNIMEDQNPKIPNRYISRIAVDPVNESDIFITLSGFGSGHVWRSVDGGILWKDFSGDLPDVPVNDIVLFNNPNTGMPNCIIATDCGVFVTYDISHGKWYELGPGLPNSIAMKLDYKQTSPILRVATHGRGIWEINLAAAKTNGNNLNNEPKRYFLYQNIPNPFNPKTRIQYDVPKDVDVTIKVYDVVGKEVASLVDNVFKKAGSYFAEWNASNNSSGVYFYKLNAGDFVNVKRMVLIK